MNRQEAISAIQANLQESLKFAQNHLHNLREELDSAEENLAGDTHEAGRTIIEEEIQKAENAKSRSESAVNEFEKAIANPPNDHVSLGNFVKTSLGDLFIGPSLGKLDTDKGELMVVSLESPIGQAVLGAVSGDKIDYQGKPLEILQVG